MKILKYLADKKIYIIIDFLILVFGLFFVFLGVSSPNKIYSSIYISIGTSLIAAGIVVLLDLWKNFSISKIFEKTQNIINEGGVEELFNTRSINDKYLNLINNLTESIDICGYSLGAFFDNFSDKLKEKIQQNSKIKIRVIFVDCDSEASVNREKIEGKAPGSLRNRFETFKNFFNSCDNVEIRVINFPLSTMIFRIDDILFVGPHFYNRQSAATLTMELKKNKWMYGEYQKEFDRMWNDAKPINK